MAGLDIFAVQEAISGYITTTFGSAYEIIEDGIPDDAQLPRTAGRVDSFIALSWGTLVRKPGGSSMKGARWDDYYSTVDVAVGSAVGKNARNALSMVVDNLTGYRPTGGNEMAPRGNTTTFVLRDNNGNITGYAASQRMFFGVNGEDVGVPLTPPAP